MKRKCDKEKQWLNNEGTEFCYKTKYASITLASKCINKTKQLVYGHQTNFNALSIKVHVTSARDYCHVRKQNYTGRVQD